jgi:hypothetical protein
MLDVSEAIEGIGIGYASRAFHGRSGADIMRFREKGATGFKSQGLRCPKAGMLPTTLRSGRRVPRQLPVTAVTKSFAPVPGVQSQVDQWCLSLAQSWPLGPAITQLLTVIDELVSNALQHGQGEVRVDLQLRGGRVWIGVRDEGPGPVRRNEGAFPPHGDAQGLGRVARMSHVWGVHRHDGHGTTVWAELDLATELGGSR